jgi:single-stranded DNA-binding protein
VYVTEVVADNVRFLESNGGAQNLERMEQPAGGPINISDDDLPF